MPLAARRGVALVDLLVALTLFALVGLIMVRATVAAERAVRALQGSASLHAAFDAGIGYLDSELAELGAGAEPDLFRAAADSLSYRAIRGSGLACVVGPTEVLLSIDRFVASRLPQPGRDSLLMFLTADSLGATGVGWTAAPITDVGRSSCRGGPALRLGIIVDTAAAPVASGPALVPVKIFEIMQARLYNSQGERWLGARSESAGESVQPLTGPFTSASAFAYRDSLGLLTGTPSLVRTVELTLAGRYPDWAGVTPSRSDSVHSVLRPRNLWR